MAEESFPVVEKPMNGDQWRAVTLGIGSGILDQGGFPYRLKNFSNVDNTAVLQAVTSGGRPGAQAILEGFYHRLDEDMKLSFPAVSSRTRYYVVLQYDPLNTETPVRARVVTSLDTSQGKNYLHLYNVVREPNQLLTDADVRMIRPRVAPVQVYTSESDMPQAHKTLWGTLAIVHNGRNGDNAQIFMSMNTNSSGDDAEDSWFWKKVYDPSDGRFVWAERGDTASYVSPSHGYKRALGRSGKRRRFRGRVARASGATFKSAQSAGYQVWSSDLPPSDAPGSTQRFIVAAGGSSAQHASVEVSSRGSVTAWFAQDAYWIGLDGIEWEVK